MTQDITITPFFITFDVIGGCIDIQTIYDYIKSAYKKEVFILNANDYIDNSSRHSSSKNSDGSHSRRSKSKSPSSGNSNGKETDENSGSIQSGRGSRQSHNAPSNSTSRPRDNSRSVVKGFKARIESDLPKLIDNKRKFIAAQEKKRAQLEAAKNSHKKIPAAKLQAEEKPKFDGQVDVIYIITNFPYLPKQLNALFDGGIKLDAFIAFKSNDFQLDKLNKNDKSENAEKSDNRLIESLETPITDNSSTNLGSAVKSSRSMDPKKGTKKAAINGFSLDYTNNPNSYPPARWQSLQSEAPVSVSFIEITVGNDAESTFKMIVENVIQIQKAKADFQEFIEGRKFIHIPSSQPSQPQDLSHFQLFIEDNFELNQNMKSSRSQIKAGKGGIINNFTSSSSLSMNSKMTNPTVFVDAILSQLKSGDWYPVPTKKPPGKTEEYAQMFLNKSKDAARKVIVYPQRKQLEPIFEYLKEDSKSSSSFSIDFKKALPSVYEYLYKLIKWKLTYENMYACKSWCDFLKTPDNFHAYSGQKFDLMFQRINKNYKFGLPLNFFEWKDWSLSIEHENVSEVLETAVEEAGIVDTFFDEVVGLLFVFVMKPIPRNIGSFVPHVYMPLTMMVNTEWQTNIVNYSEKPSTVMINSNGTISSDQELEENAENSNNNNKKSRVPITPSFITKSYKNDQINSSLFYQLLPSLNDRFQNRENSIYKLPMYLTNSEEFTTPYFFEKSNMYVHIIRNCVHGQMTFNFKAFINKTFQLFSSQNSISILPVENICFYFTFPFTVTIFFYQQSICYDSSKLILKTAGETPIVVTKSGDLMFMKDQNTPLIVKKDGTIGQMLQKGKWTYVNKDGETYKPRFHKKKGKMVNSKVDLPHSSFYDGSKGIKTMIRPDGFEYVISKKGKRQIIFKNEIIVVQDDSKSISYDIPSFPMIEHNEENESLSFEIDKFKCVFKEKTAEIQCDEFSVVYKEGSILLKYNAVISAILPSQPPPTSPPQPSQPPKSSQNQTVADSNSEAIVNNVNCEVYITPSSVELKSGEKDVLFASRDGTEKKGELLIPDENGNEGSPSKKKKIEYIETHWGKLVPIKETYTEVQQMELHKIFSPRFFVVRSDLSATQYFRPDVFNLEGYREYRKTILHPAGDSVNIVTYHQEEQLPFLFIENKTLTKIDRVNLLKSVHIPKPPKKKNNQHEPKTAQTDNIRRPCTAIDLPKEQPPLGIQKVTNSMQPLNKNFLSAFIIDNVQNHDSPDAVLNTAYESHSKMNEIARRFQLLLTRALARAQDTYIDDIMPPPPPPKEVLRVPPQTPIPRLLDMQHNLYDLTAAGRYNANYWKCNESEFGFPIDETHKAEQPLSPRTKLHDPPRLFKPERKSSLSRPVTAMTSVKKQTAISRPFSANFLTQKSTTPVICPEIESKEILKPKVVQLNKTRIDLGTVFVGECKTGEISAKNSTLKPLRFNLSQFKSSGENNSNVLRALTIPGVIMPGLTVPVKIQLEAKCVDEIDTYFEFRTPIFSSKIQVTATVVKNPKIERKKKKVKKFPDIIIDLNDYEYDYEYEEEEEEEKKDNLSQ
ncbi:hypothetical protein M9Y10_027518 [Tritrichomonas musculus]|uniref:Sperm-associated antigen 17 n=1 Tax=Tritrichomonas musculus TaxID=1915356 RepID=A0ABR2H542_9EUKA